MLFGWLVRRAENAVEGVLDQAISRIIIALPLLVAAGFATASASVFLNKTYGPEIGNLIVAGAFAAMALIAWIFSAARRRTAPAQPTVAADSLQEQEEAIDAEASTASLANSLTSSERELLSSLLASAAPIAVPGLIRIILRNIPLFIALILAVYVMTRGEQEASTTPAPSEAPT